jgi:hypothetical protein
VGLPGYANAASLLADFEGLDRYLQSRGVTVGRADRHGRPGLALRALLEDVFAEQTDFALREGRMREALERLESSAFASASEVRLVGTLHGLTIASPELLLRPGLVLSQPDALGEAPAGALSPEEGSEGWGEGCEHGHLLASLASEETDVRVAIERGRETLRELLRALRLYGDGRVTLGALAWVRVGVGSWSPLALGAGGRPHGMLFVGAEQEDELRAFCNLLARRAPRGNGISWALRRFEMGCERPSELEALSDHLLALRALLEPEGYASGLLARRLAALCATPERRPELLERLTRTIALEREVLAGSAAEHAGGQLLVRDLSDHLRALLRDVICGHLDPDLAGLADGILADEAGDTEASPAEESPSGADPWYDDQLQLVGRFG